MLIRMQMSSLLCDTGALRLTSALFPHAPTHPFPPAIPYEPVHESLPLRENRHTRLPAPNPSTVLRTPFTTCAIRW